jgi:predicted HAD superfamily Cof-like phosphohydrolase
MEIKDIKNWFEIAIPEPTKEQSCVQIGCHYEEVAEMLDATDDYNNEITYASGRYKACDSAYMEIINDLTDDEKVELLDSLADQIVTAIGVAHMLGMDIEGALEEVNRSNHSKFEDGKAVFDENGKIKKGKYYTGPQLKKFIGK